MRFATGTNVQPTMSFKGHVNSYLPDLVRRFPRNRSLVHPEYVFVSLFQGIAADPTSTFLFAAGQDRRIRAWSLRTGEQFGALLGGTQLETPARALAVTQSDGSPRGTRWLWIAQENEVRVVRLGR